MLYAILAYHAEDVVAAWSREEDKALMDDLLAVHNRLVDERKLGPAARLDMTSKAVTLRGEGAGMVIDGPFAETKEQLLGFYVGDFENQDQAIAAARDMRRANPTAVYEIRPVLLYIPGTSLPEG